jgi:hypothetical protein
MMLAVTLEQLRRGRRLPLADCLRMELGLVRAAIAHGDIVEGIRAQIIDKDNRPRWEPASLEAVDREAVERFFVSPWSTASHPLSHLQERALP